MCDDEKKAEIEVVDLKAEQKDLEATTSLVNVINQIKIAFLH